MSATDKDYHWPDEEGGVMFALRHSRDLECEAKVYDPDGKLIVSFQPREYDWKALRKRRPSYIFTGGELQTDIARAYRERESGGTSKKEGKPRRTAAAKKAASKKASGGTRTIKRTRQANSRS